MTFDARDPGTTSAEWMRDPRFAGLPVFSLTGVDRMIVVAAHPDDETLGAGALLASAAARRIPTAVVIITDGAASHPGSPTLDGTTLAATRAAEVQRALHLLNPDATLTLLDFPDGGVLENRAAITAALGPLLPAPGSSSGERTLLVCPWRGDGHRDHRVVGEICAELAAPSAPGGASLSLLEYPIWLWHWGSPAAGGDASADTASDATVSAGTASADTASDTATPWNTFVALPVTPGIRAVKRAAVAAHRSQTEPLSDAPGDEPLLNPTFLQNFDRDREVFIVADISDPTASADATTATAASGTTAANSVAPASPDPAASRAPQLPAGYFDDTYARHDDPWGFTDRWYEERKRSVTLAALPRPHFANTLEIGCSIGVLTAQLAPRTDHLLALDIAPAAIDRARQRLADSPHVDLRVQDVAETFPTEAGPFDLILLSEVGYYFDEATLRRVLDGTTASLAADGVFVACHWRHPVADYLQSGDGVHSVIADVAQAAGWSRLARHLEEDFVLDVYTPDPRSVAEQTGLL